MTLHDRLTEIKIMEHKLWKGNVVSAQQLLEFYKSKLIDAYQEIEYMQDLIDKRLNLVEEMVDVMEED